MPFFYDISHAGDRVRSSIHECDSMDIGGFTYVRTPGVHGWICRPSEQIFETRRACEFALVSALALLAKRLAEEAGECLNIKR